MWAIGNIVGDGPQLRDEVLGLDVVASVIKFLHMTDNDISALRNAAWTMSNFARGKPKPSLDYLKPLLPEYRALLHSTDSECVVDACWGLSYLSDGPNDAIQAVLDQQVLPRIVELMISGTPQELTPALRTLGNIVTGSEEQTQAAIDAGALKALHRILSDPNAKKGARKEACWAASNITAGTTAQIQAVLDSGLIEVLATHVTEDFEVLREAGWAAANLTDGGTGAQIIDALSKGSFSIIRRLLAGFHTDAKVQQICLTAIENVLTKSAESFSYLEDLQIWDILEQMDPHAESSVQDKVEACKAMRSTLVQRDITATDTPAQLAWERVWDQIKTFKSPQDLNKPYLGWTALHFAAEQGNVEVVSTLVSRKVNINAPIEDPGTQTLPRGFPRQFAVGSTALHIAAYRGNEEITRILLDAGANANAADKNGWTPLFYCARNRRSGSCVSLLVNAGASAQTQVKDQMTGLSAQRNGDNSDTSKGVVLFPDTGLGNVVVMWETLKEWRVEPISALELEQDAQRVTTAQDVAQLHNWHADFTACLSSAKAAGRAKSAHPEAAKAEEETEEAPVEDANSITNRLRALVSGGEGKTPTQQIMRSKLILLGEGRVGKTATSKSLLWQPFDHGEKSTIGCSSRDARLDAQTAQGWEKVGAGRELNRVLAAALRAGGDTRQAGISVDRALRTKGLKQRRDDDGDDQPRRQRMRSMHGSRVQHRGNNDDDDDEEEEEEEEDLKKGGKKSADPNGRKGSVSKANGKMDGNNSSSNNNNNSNNDTSNNNNEDNDDDLDDDENFGLKQLLDKVQLSLQQEPGSGGGDNSQHILYSMWDFAGQSVFYDLLHILMTRFGVYLLCFDMAKVLNSAKRADALAYVKHWLNAIALHAPGAPVCFVGTHKDVVKSRNEHEEISQILSSSFASHLKNAVFNESEDIWFFPVDNTTSGADPTFASLRSSIDKAVREQEYVTLEVPINWLGCLDYLRGFATKSGTPVKRISLTKFRSIARRFNLKDNVSQKQMLRVFHEFGLLLYYDDPGLSDVVILDPQWLLDSFSAIIRDFNMHIKPRDKAALLCHEEWLRLKDHAQLSSVLLPHLWPDHTALERDMCLKLMCKHHQRQHTGVSDPVAAAL